MTTINDGVAQPKNYRSPTPAKGGAKLTDEQMKAVATCVWSLSQRQRTMILRKALREKSCELHFCKQSERQPGCRLGGQIAWMVKTPV